MHPLFWQPISIVIMNIITWVHGLYILLLILLVPKLPSDYESSFLWGGEVLVCLLLHCLFYFVYTGSGHMPSLLTPPPHHYLLHTQISAQSSCPYSQWYATSRSSQSWNSWSCHSHVLVWGLWWLQTHNILKFYTLLTAHAQVFDMLYIANVSCLCFISFVFVLVQVWQNGHIQHELTQTLYW